jgi:hypothetical protein
MFAELKRILPELARQLLYVQNRLVLRRIDEVLRRILKRRFGLIFFSPAKALKAACRKPAGQNTLAVLITTAQYVRLAKEISIHENVVSYPLTEAISESDPGIHYFGGLANPATQKLIREAIHCRGVAGTQALPMSSIEKYSPDKGLEIRQPVLYGGILFNHFGHFIVESLCRLYAYPMVREIDPFILFHSQWGLPRYLEKNNFVNQVLTGLGIPVDRLIFVEQVARISEVIIPTQKYGFGFTRQPDELFVKFVRSFQFKHKVPGGFEKAEKIYVSRSNLQNKGRQIGEKIFEAYLAGEGYRMFYPERHTFFEQLTVYTRAERLIFSEGSALFSCIFLPEMKADVAVVCRRREPHQSTSGTTDCLHGFGKNILWIDAVRGQYQFGLDTWDALADIDWCEVSRLLREHGFVNNLFRNLTGDDYQALVRSELREYLRVISGNQKFVDYMMRFKETYPLRMESFDRVDHRDG